ncbi:MAG: ECF transporter S component [Defluviitaleaceae bacterium]|nr:ECF transporter S component [Defluviitaleaceae bacterium]
MSNSNATKVQSITGIALLAAIIVILQVVATFIRPGLIPVNLVLPTIVIGSAMYGAKAGALLGLCFGAVVLSSGISGTAPMSTMMWSASPLLMTVVTLGRGAAQGYAAGVVYTMFKKKSTFAGVLAAAIVAPIVNTGIFLGALILLFRDTLVHFAGDTNALYFAFMVMAGTNFLFELIVNVVLVSAIDRIIRVVRKTSFSV